MRFGTKKQAQRPNVIVTQSSRKNDDQLYNDASLKAAQAIFKKHSTLGTSSTGTHRNLSVMTSTESENKNKKSFSGRPVSHVRPVSPCNGVPRLNENPHTNGTLLSPQQAAAVALEHDTSEEEVFRMPRPIRVIPTYQSSSSGASSATSHMKKSPTNSIMMTDNRHSLSLESLTGITGIPSTSNFQGKTTPVRIKPPPPTSSQLGVDSDSVVYPVEQPVTDNEPLMSITYDTTSKMKVPVTYEGTLPDLIPGHQRHKKKRWHNIFGSATPSSDVSLTGVRSGLPITSTMSELQLNPSEENVVVKSTKPSQKSRFRTTLRSNNTDRNKKQNSYNSNGYNSDESTFSSDSDAEWQLVADGRPENDKNVSRKGDISTVGHVQNSRRKHHKMLRQHKLHSFNEDKPWKSHVDIGYISERERKRYEGIWVSNRNTYLELLPWYEKAQDSESRASTKDYNIPEDGLILNQVVADIWGRSNLSSSLLSQIYDKVDTRRDGTLNRQSFLIGMWLVDQCLYGRKLPEEIDQRVWDSVDRFTINIPNKNPHHQHRRRKKLLKKELKTIKKELKAPVAS